MTMRSPSLFPAGRQTGPVNAVGEMKPAGAELVQFRFQGGDKAPLLRLHQHPDCAEERDPSSGEYAAAGRFVHDDEVGVQLFGQDDCFALSAIQMGLKAGYLGVVADRPPVDPGSPGRLGSARASDSLDHDFIVDSAGRQSAHKGRPAG